MIVLTLILIIISLAVFVFMNRREEAFWLSGIFIGFILINLGLMFFYAKMGGLTVNEQILFFLNNRIQGKIQDVMITLDNIARLLTIGKYTFLFFVLMFSLNLTEKIKNKVLTVLLLLLWPVCNIVLTDPLFFEETNRVYRIIVDISTYSCTYIYLIISMVILVKEYVNHNIRWVKKQLRYIILAVVNLIVYFIMFCQLNPVYIFYSQSISYFDLGFKFYRLRFSTVEWMMVTIVFSFFVVVGLKSLLSYTKVNLEVSREQVSLERQLDTANMGTRVFIHGIKNQLLAESIVLRRLKQSVQAEPMDEASIIKHIDELNLLNKHMTSRMDDLYKVFKHNSITLVPCELKEIVGLSLEKLAKKLDNIQCEVIEKDVLILADAGYLSEAVYNILSNAVDAIKASPRADEGKIKIEIKVDHKWCAIRVDDNGIGMEKSKITKIFEPFYTEKNTNSNWGIGLSYVKKIVKYHFGDVHVISTLGEGTAFILAFPKYFPPKE